MLTVLCFLLGYFGILVGIHALEAGQLVGMVPLVVGFAAAFYGGWRLGAWLNP